MYVYVSEYARMWHEYSFGFEIAYRCLIWWLRKKVFQKNLFYIFQCVLLSILFLSFALHFYVARKWSKKEKKRSNCQLFAIPYETNVRNSNQFQYSLNVLRFSLMFFTPTSSSSSLSLCLPILFNFHSIAMDLWSTVDYWCTCEHFL